MRWQIFLTAALLSVAACSGSDEPEAAVRPLGDPDATTTTSAVTTTSSSAPAPTTAAPTTTEPDPWAVPENPDAAYFERVLNELEAGLTEATRLALGAGEVTEDATRLLAEVSTGINLEYNLRGLESLVSADQQLLTLDVGPSIEVLGVVNRQDEGVVVETIVSYDGVYIARRAPDDVVFEIVQAPRSGTNRTGWLVSQRHTPDTSPGELCVDY